MSDITDLLSYYEKQKPTGFETLATSLPYLNYTQGLNSYNTDLNSKKYKQFYGQYKQQGAATLSDAIAELQRQNRKASYLGRTPLFGDERGGETLFRGLMQGQQDVNNAASGQALGATQQYQQLRQQNDLQKADVMGNIFGAGAKMIGSNVTGNIGNALTKLFGL